MAILGMVLATLATGLPVPQASLPPTTPNTWHEPTSTPRNDPYAADSERDLRDTLASIDRRRRMGTITRDQARAFKAEASLIRALQAQMGQDGLSESERQSIVLRTQALKSAAQLLPAGR